MRDPGDGRQVGSREGLKRQRLARRSTCQPRWTYVYHSSRNTRCGISERAFDLGDCLVARDFARDDEQRRATRRSQRLAPRAHRKQTWPSAPGIGAHEHDVGVAPRSKMLKRIVEDDDINTMRDCLANSPYAIRRSNDWHSRIEALVHPGLDPY